jgi:hypothetical protein
MLRPLNNFLEANRRLASALHDWPHSGRFSHAQAYTFGNGGAGKRWAH